MDQQHAQGYEAPDSHQKLPFSVFYQSLFDPKQKPYVLLLGRGVWIAFVLVWLCYERYTFASPFSETQLIWGWFGLTVWAGISLWGLGLATSLPKSTRSVVWILILIDSGLLGSLVGLTGAHLSIALLPASVLAIAVIVFASLPLVVASHVCLICASALSVWYSPLVAGAVDWQWLTGGYSAITLLSFASVFYLDKCIKPSWLASLNSTRFKALKLESFESQPHGMMLCDRHGYIHLANPKIVPFVNSIIKSGKSTLAFSDHFRGIRHVDHIQNRIVCLPHPDTNRMHTFKVDATKLASHDGLYLIQWIDVSLLVETLEGEALQQKYQLFYHGVRRAFKDFWPAMEAYMSIIDERCPKEVMSGQVGPLIQRERNRLLQWAEQFKSQFIQSIPIEQQPEDVLRLVTAFYEEAMRHPKLLSEGVSIWVHNRLSDSVQVMVDRERLMEALMHLLDNAVDAVCQTGTHKTGITIETTIEGSDAVISVIDSGGSLTETIRPHAFDPYFTTKGGHAGLGLHKAYHIVSSMGGRMKLSCNPQKETTMSLYFTTDQPHQHPESPSSAEMKT